MVPTFYGEGDDAWAWQIAMEQHFQEKKIKEEDEQLVETLSGLRGCALHWCRCLNGLNPNTSLWDFTKAFIGRYIPEIYVVDKEEEETNKGKFAKKEEIEEDKAEGEAQKNEKDQEEEEEINKEEEQEEEEEIEIGTDWVNNEEEGKKEKKDKEDEQEERGDKEGSLYLIKEQKIFELEATEAEDRMHLVDNLKKTMMAQGIGVREDVRNRIGPNGGRVIIGPIKEGENYSEMANPNKMVSRENFEYRPQIHITKTCNRPMAMGPNNINPSLMVGLGSKARSLGIKHQVAATFSDGNRSMAGQNPTVNEGARSVRFRRVAVNQQLYELELEDGGQL